MTKLLIIEPGRGHVNPKLLLALADSLSMSSGLPLILEFHKNPESFDRSLLDTPDVSQPKTTRNPDKKIKQRNQSFQAKARKPKSQISRRKR